MKKQIKKILSFFKNKKREFELKKNLHFITKDHLKNDLKALGVTNGDILFLHSSLKSIGYIEKGAQTVVCAIMETIGEEGTLIVPTYSMKGTMINTCLDDTYLFDPRTDIKGLGAIPSAVLKLKGVKSSIHPTHCVSAIGNHADFITNSHHVAESTFGKGSPWEKFLKLNGKLLGLGISLGPVTFYHLLEDLELANFPLPVRMEKYLLKCRDWDGNMMEVPVNPLDPEYAKFRIDQKEREDLRKFLWEKFTNDGVITISKVGESLSWIASSQTFYSALKELMKKNITIYSKKEELESIHQ